MEFIKNNNSFYLNFEGDDRQVSDKQVSEMDNTTPVECIKNDDKIPGCFNGEFKFVASEDIEDWELSGEKPNDFQYVSEVVVKNYSSSFVLKPMNHNMKISKNEKMIIKFCMSGNDVPYNLVLRYKKLI